jgi:hypothetical protein
MKKLGPKPARRYRSRRQVAALLLVFLGSFAPFFHAQTPDTAQTPDKKELAQQIQQLTEAMARAQTQLQESQRQLDEMRAQLTALQRQLAQGDSAASAPAAPIVPMAAAPSSSSTQTVPTDTAKAIDDLRERQDMLESQVATHEQTKVETESKYPLKITGLLLFSGFVNTNAVDLASTPTLALPGSGSTGATVRQTILGFDARGPHLLGAQSHADLRVDFDGNPQSSSAGTSYSGYYGNSTLLRLRTAHAGLQWENTEVYFSLDRPIFSPDAPTSLTATAEPALAWSGNLWTWNPQLGATHDILFGRSEALRLQAALIDAGDATLPAVASSSSSGTPPASEEQSRWPGFEGRIALLGSTSTETSSHIGVGGYFAPHVDPRGRRFDAWAATLDTRLQLPQHFSMTGSFYRGLALGGLGGGVYKDLAYAIDADSGNYYYHPLDDVGGWAQLKQTINQRVELNAAFGIDNGFASQLRRYTSVGGPIYQNLARNRTFTGNVIYTPSTYLIFSLEYRRLESSPANSPTVGSNIIGLGAGYRF